jgi:ADP-ribose pyrophosphatase
MQAMKNDLPPDAKLVFKGAIFEVWQWEQKMFDGSTQIFEKVKRPDSADVIAVVGDKIVIETQEQPHRSPFTCIPGGRCDENENPMDGAKRELLEETGHHTRNPLGSGSISQWRCCFGFEVRKVHLHPRAVPLRN